MGLAYNLNIPDGPHNPSNDWPLMQTNTNSTNTIWGVDHYNFGSNTYGQHQLVTFAGKNTPGAQTDPASALYTASGTANTNAELFYKNQSGIFPIGIMRAFAAFASNGTILNGYNVSGVVRNSAGNWTVTLNANVVTGTNYAILPYTLSNTGGVVTKSIVQLTITSATQFNFINQKTDGTGNYDSNYNTFLVLQV